ncbi:MAG: ComF family protein [Bacteroidetes bacterium]|nr:ComF family protein [Bacteroidota bacterium]
MPNESIAGLAEGARSLLRATIGLVYPTLCLGCEVRLPEITDNGLPICPACLRRLPRAAPEQVNKRLVRLFEAGGVFNEVFALWVFDEGGTIQRLQHALKYQNRPQLGVRLGRYMAKALDQSLDQPLYDAVFPIPLARRRQLERGYNQSRRLALGMAEVLDGHPDVPQGLLVRTRTTRPQTNLSRTKRWTNVSGAFGMAEPTGLTNQRVLLVDDILTTGATMTAAALPLREAGAVVDLAVFAVVAV